MLTIGLITALAMPGVNVTPVGEPEEVKAGKKTAYVFPSDGLALEIEGPGALMLELYAAKDLKGSPISVAIVRDKTHQSVNKLTPKRRGGPRRYPHVAKVGIKVPEGKHTYLVTVDPGHEGKLALAGIPAHKIPKRLAAAPEVEVPASESEPGAKQATAEAGEPGEADQSAATDGAADATLAAAPTTGMEEIMAGGTQIVAGAGSAALPAGAKTNLTQALRVAVYDFEAQDVPENIRRVVTDSVLTEVRKLQGVSAIGMDEIRDMLSHEANKQVLGCESDESCLAEIAGALGVDDLVTGKLSKVDEESNVIIMRRINQRRADVLGSLSRRLKSESGQEFLAAVGPAIEELFPERELKQGTERGVPKEMALRLDPPPLPEWSFWSVSGAAVVTAAAGGVFGMLMSQAEKDYKQFVRQGEPAESGGGGQVISGATLMSKRRNVQSHADTANYLFIGAGVLAVTSAVMALFTDWYGYGEAEVTGVSQ